MSTKISNKPPDKNHPFGHGRIEIISSLVIGILLCVVGFSFIKESAVRLYHKESCEFGTSALVIVIISIVAKELLAQFAIILGKKVKSVSIITDGYHHRQDALSSVIILAGIFLGKYFWWIDGALGIIVGVIILYATFDILKSAISKLMGEKPDEDLIMNLNEILSETYTCALHFHHLHVHSYGDHNELTFHIKMPGTMTLQEAHDITTMIEKQIRKKLNFEATIHMEPFYGNKFNNNETGKLNST